MITHSATTPAFAAANEYDRGAHAAYAWFETPGVGTAVIQDVTDLLNAAAEYQDHRLGVPTDVPLSTWQGTAIDLATAHGRGFASTVWCEVLSVVSPLALDHPICPECRSTEGTYWCYSNADTDVWSCRCGHDWTICVRVGEVQR